VKLIGSAPRVGVAMRTSLPGMGIIDGHGNRLGACGGTASADAWSVQCCGHDVICHFAILEKYRRFWLDLDQQMLFGVACARVAPLERAVEWAARQ